jgi:divinyl chlorophyllide a 8-vinyl-reductase
LIGRQIRTRSVPPGLLAGIASLLSLPGRFVPTIADKAEFARIGHYYATESMLLWDPQARRYDDAATPEFGAITLEDSYRAQLAGLDRQDLGSHAMFD